MNTIGNLVTATLNRSTQIGQQISQQVRAGWILATTEGDVKL